MKRNNFTAGLLPVQTSDQVLVYQDDTPKNWCWHEPSYPRDMILEVFLQDPRSGDTFSPSLDNQLLGELSQVDFNRQFAIYVRLGTTASRGYNIAIQKVMQSGNELVITVNLKSPRLEENLDITQDSDFIILNRSCIQLNAPISVTFIDQNDMVLSTYNTGRLQ